MARSVWKGPFVDGYLLKKADAAHGSGRKEVIKTWSRRSTTPATSNLRRLKSTTKFIVTSRHKRKK